VNNGIGGGGEIESKGGKVVVRNQKTGFIREPSKFWEGGNVPNLNYELGKTEGTNRTSEPTRRAKGQREEFCVGN